MISRTSANPSFIHLLTWQRCALVVAHLSAEHHVGSFVAVHRLSGCSEPAQSPCGMRDLSSATRDGTCILCIAKVDSQALDHQGSPCAKFS